MTTVIADAAIGRPAQFAAAGHLIRREVPPQWRAGAWWLERRRRGNFATKVDIDLEAIVRSVAAEDGVDPEEIMAELQTMLRRRP